MSKKVIIVWIVFVLIFASLGLFGFLNQDLLTNEEETPYVPKTNESLKKCTGSLANANVVYQFKENENGVLEKTVINYYNKNNVLSEYETITSLTSASYTGITSTLSGTNDNYQVTIVVDSSNVEPSLISNNDSLKNLGILISRDTSYSEYTYKITSGLTNFNFVCD